MRMQEAFMEDDRKQTVAGIKAKVERDDYTVDPTAVADALLKRLREMAEARREHVGSEERGPRYRECSYPSSSSSGESANRRPASPGSTRPTQVNPWPSAWSRRAASALAQALWGTQAQIS
jgi:hypothetical protein